MLFLFTSYNNSLFKVFNYFGKTTITNDPLKQKGLEKIKQRLAAIHLDMALKDLPVTSELIIEILLKGRKKIENKKIIGLAFYNEWDSI